MKRRAPPCRSPRFNGLLEELEPRLLFSADAGVLLDPTAMAAAGQTPNTSQVQLVPPPEAATVQRDTTTADEPLSAPNTAPQAEVDAATQVIVKPIEIVFVDSRVKDAQTLVSSIIAQQDGQRTLEIHWLDGDKDGITQISQVLQDRHDVAAVHIVSHGADGALQLGATLLNSGNLHEHADELAGWRQALTDDADVMIYGCDVAATPAGQHFIDDLGLLTGADVAASTDATGAKALGGDWDLEFQYGQIEAASLIQHPGANEWQGLLGITPNGAETGIPVTAGNEATVTNRQVATDSSGNFVVIWQDGTNIKAQRYLSDGSVNGATLTVTASGTNSDAQVAMNASGAFVVVWNDSNGNAMFRTYTNAGVAGTITTVAAKTSVSTGYPFYSATDTTTNIHTTVAINTAGEFVVAYQAHMISVPDVPWYSGTNTDTIKWKAYTAAGALQGSNNSGDVSSNTEGNASPSIGMNGAGAFVISYSDSGGNIYARRYSATRGVLSGAGDITGNTGGTQSSASMDSSGNYVVAYNDAGVIKFRVYNSSGTATTAVTTANSIAAGTPNSPSVSMDTNGNFTIAWQNSNQDANPGNGVYLRLFNGSGVSNMSDLRVNTTTAGNQQYASIAINSNNAVAVWSGNGTGDASGVFFQKFNFANAAPTISATASNPAFTEAAGVGTQAAAVNPFSGAAVSTIESGQLITSLTFQVSGIVDGANERLVVDGTTITLGGDISGTTSTNGMGYAVSIASGTATIVLTHTGVAASAVQTLVNGISYQNTITDNPTAGARVFTLKQIKDNGGTADGGADTTNVSIASTVTVAALNDSPVLSGTNNFTGINEDDTTSGGTLISALISGKVSDADNGALSGIAVTAVDNTNGAWQYTTNGGTNWTAFGTPSATASRLLANNASTLIRFVPNANWNGSATITYRAWDQTSGAAGGTANTSTNGNATAYSSATASPSITVSAVNDAPVFSSAINFTSITEDQTTNAGQLVSSLFTSTDVDSGAVKGIALYSQTPSNGTWQYSTNGGSSWTAVGTVSGTSALLLKSTDYVRFVPDANNADSASVSFYIWDQTTGSTGTKVDVSTRGATTAYSSSGGTSTITVTAVNDAPVLSGTNNLTAINEDNTTSGGTLISALISGKATDVDSGAASGIAVTAVDNTNGTWQYTTNGGTNWTAFGTPTATASRLLANNASTLIRFVPNANWNGTASITYRAWDQTSGTAGSTANTSTNGTTTAYSTATASPTITVNPVNDAPVLSGTNNFTAINEDSNNSAGSLVSALISGKVSDIDSGAVSGIAVTAVDNTNGTWQYTTNGGSSWTAFGTPSAAASRLLASDASTSIRFVPNANWNGSATITYRAWDQTSGTAGSTSDTSTNGTTTAFSTATASPSLTVNAVNDAPTLSATALNPSFTEAVGAGVQAGAVNLFSGAAVSTIEAGQTITSLTLTISGLLDGANEKLLIDGRAITLGAGSAGTTVTNSMSYTVTVPGDGTATITLTHATGVTAANIQTLINGITYQDTSADNPTVGVRTFTLTQIKDSGGTTNGGVDTTSVSIASSVTVSALNDAPVATDDLASTSPGVNIDIAVKANDNDPDNTLASLTVVVDSFSVGTNAYVNGDGTIHFEPGVTAGPQTVTYHLVDANGAVSGTATLTINVAPNNPPSGTNGSVGINEDNSHVFVQGDFGFSDPDAGQGTMGAVRIDSIPVKGTLLLNGVAVSATDVISGADIAAGKLLYTPVANESGNNYATFTFTVQDIATAYAASSNTMTINVTAVNDAPVLTGNSDFATITEDNTNNAGQLVSSLFTSTDVDSGAIKGIAIHDVASGNGTWQYSLNGGSSWTNVGAVSTSSALLLRSTDYLRFVPDGRNADSASLSFYAWDQTTVEVAGDKADVSSHGGTTAFSLDTGAASITVTAVNDAPVWVGSSDFNTISEDATNNSGQLVSDLFNSTDVDSGAVNGVAIYSKASGNGTWQYSLDGGGSWTNMGAVSGTSALLLRASDHLRFVPDGRNADTASLSYYAWDQSTGVAGGQVDVSATGGSTAFSSASGTSAIAVTAVNDAPVLNSAVNFTPINEDDTNNNGQLVSSLLNSTDVDSGALGGVAVNFTNSGNGNWQYSLDGGATWADIGTVSDSSALLLRAIDRVRFVPDGLNADSVSLSFFAWDQTSGGAPGDLADASVQGGTTAFSLANRTANLTVNAVNDAPVLTGANDFASITEDDTNNGGQLVSTLISTTDIDNGAVNGVAVYGQSPGNGTWQYSIDGGSTWAAMGSVSGSSALLLRATDYLRFVPDGRNADTASITFRAWDQSSGTAGTKADASAQGGTTAFSVGSASANVTVTSLNDAPVLGSAHDFIAITEDDISNAGQLVSTLITRTDVDGGAVYGVAVYGQTSVNGTWQYSLDGGSSWSDLGAVDQNLALVLRSTDRIRFVPDGQNAETATLSLYAWDQSSGNAAGDKVDATNRGGTTAFSATGGTASITVTAVNDAPVLTGSNDFAPITEDDANNGGQLVSTLITGTDLDNGTNMGMAVYSLSAGRGTWQYSVDGGNSWTNVGTVSSTSALLLGDSDHLRFVPDGIQADTASVSFHAWDQSAGAAGSKVDISAQGGTSAFSLGSASSSIVVTNLNDAPVFTNAHDFTPITEDDNLNGGQFVSDLIDSTDVDTAALKGIAIYGQTPGHGLWQYSVNGGGTWLNLGAIGNGSALLLGSGDKIRYVPDGLNADTASLTFYAWDQSAGLAGNKVDATRPGGTSPFSLTGGTSTLTITAINDAPVLNGTNAFTSINEDDTGNVGTKVSVLIAGHASDVDTGAIQGIAVTAVDNTHGDWQYTTDGSTWISFGAVSTSSSLLLAADADTAIRFVPNANWNGSTSLSFSAWDRSAGTVGNTVDTSIVGGVTAFSASSQSANLVVLPVNDAPDMPDLTLTASATPTMSWDASTLLAQATDIDGDTLSVRIVQGPTHGQWTALGNNQFRYTTELGYVGADSITYVVNDGQADSATVRHIDIQASYLLIINAPDSSTGLQGVGSPNNTPTVDNKPGSETDTTAGSGTTTNPDTDKPLELIKGTPPSDSTNADDSSDPTLVKRIHGSANAGQISHDVLYANRQALMLTFYANGHAANEAAGTSVIQLLELIKPNVQAVSGDLNLLITPLNTALQALPLRTSKSFNELARNGGDTIQLSKAATYSTGLGLSIGTIWWTARVSGLITSALISTPAWRALDPLPVVTSPDDDEEAMGDSDNRLGDKEVEHLFDADRPLEQDLPIIQ